MNAEKWIRDSVDELVRELSIAIDGLSRAERRDATHPVVRADRLANSLQDALQRVEDGSEG